MRWEGQSSAVPSHCVCVCVCVCVHARVCCHLQEILLKSDYVMWFHMSDRFPLYASSETLAHHFNMSDSVSVLALLCI